MKLIVGLGNPGRKYEGTRHNIGFAVLAELVRRHGTSKPKKKFQGEFVEASFDSVRGVLLAPHTYMNESGRCVRAAIDFYKLSTEDLLIICDDFNLPLGKLRFRGTGSAGGQKGLTDIIRALGRQDFARLRIGIGLPPQHYDPADFVLSRFTKQEKKEIDITLVEAENAVADWVRLDVDDCMNRYN